VKNFLREFWLWILIPVLVVVGGVLFLLFLEDSGPSSQFTYNVF